MKKNKFNIIGIIVLNKKVCYDYYFEDKMEVGIVL